MNGIKKSSERRGEEIVRKWSTMEWRGHFVAGYEKRGGEVRSKLKKEGVQARGEMKSTCKQVSDRELTPFRTGKQVEWSGQ